MSPKSIRCSIENNDDIEEVIDKLMYDVYISLENGKKKKYKYVKILHNQRLIHVIMNLIYYIFSRYNIIKYQKIYKIKTIFCMIDKKMHRLHIDSIKIFDNCFKLNKKINIPYEYVKTVYHENKFITVNLIPNERNITKIYVETNNNENIFKQISLNMQYHVRYHQINQNAIKYYQKFHSKPLELY